MYLRTLIAFLVLTIPNAGHSADTSTSRFTDNVERLHASPLPPEEGEKTFRWDFSEGKEYYFDYSQTSASVAVFHEVSDGDLDNESLTESKGIIAFKAQADHTANLVMQDMEISMTMQTPDGEAKKMAQRVPNLVMEGVSENGDLAETNLRSMVTKTDFPLPRGALSVGESETIPFTVPFNVLGSRLLAKGGIEITFVGFVDWKGVKCTHLDFNIKVSRLDVPEELEGVYSLRLDGRGRAFFDLAERRFVESLSAFIMEMKVDAPVPETSGFSKDDPDAPKRFRSYAFSDNLIHVKMK